MTKRHEVILEISQKTVELADGTYILEGLEALGVPMEADCRNGVCGACMTRCTGLVEWATDQHCLDAGHINLGYILTCICKIKGPLRLSE